MVFKGILVKPMYQKTSKEQITHYLLQITHMLHQTAANLLGQYNIVIVLQYLKENVVEINYKQHNSTINFCIIQNHFYLYRISQK